MKRVMIGGLLACFIQSSMAAKALEVIPASLVFKQLEQAEKYCPSVADIKFEAGEKAPGPLGRVGYLTATFSANLNGTIFMNSVNDAQCIVGTPNPRAVLTKADHVRAKKDGASICYVMTTPIVSADTGTIKGADFNNDDGRGNYGDIKNGVISCKYKYTGAMTDPDTSRPMSGTIILRSQKK